MSKKFIFIIITTIIIIAVFALGRFLSGQVSVKVETVKRKEFLVTVTSTSTGTVKTDTEVRVSAERAGTVKRTLFEEGDVVKKGALMAELDYKEVMLKRRGVESAVKAKRRRIEEIKNLIESLRAEVEADISETKSVLDEEGQRYNSYRKLYEKGYVSKITLDEAKRRYDVAVASHKRALSGYNRLKAKEEELRIQRDLIRESESELKLIELNYRRSFIRAPIDGVVTSKNVKAGDTLMTGAVVATVVDPERLYIESPVDEADIGRVRLGDDVRVIMDAYPEQTFDGKVVSISPVVLGKRLEARTFKVKVLLNERPPTLKPGMSADVEIIVGRVEGGLIVPTQSIVESGGKKLVYQIVDDRARLKEVKTGLFNWSFTEIKEGLNEGDRIVINPDVPGLKDAVRVRVD
jgi:HlyD family secretion protein